MPEDVLQIWLFYFTFFSLGCILGFVFLMLFRIWTFKGKN